MQLRTLTGFAGLSWALSVPSALALTTGGLEVVVQDEDGLPVPRAEVTLSGPHLVGGTRITVADAEGHAEFDNLDPAADYQVEIGSSIGEALVENVQIFVGKEVSLTVVVGEVEQVIVDKARPITQGDTTFGDSMDKWTLDRLPGQNSFQDMTRMIGGPVGTVRGGNPQFMGAAADETTTMIDGVNTTDPVTGTFSQNFNVNAIQQLDVLLGGFMPEYGVSLGGVINIVTRTGSNQLEFESSVLYNDGNWRPRMDERLTADGLVVAPSGFENRYRQIQVRSLASGPIVRDKAYFVVSYQHTRSLINASGTPQARDYDGNYVMGKVTVQPSNKHRFTARLSFDPTTIDNNVQNSQFIKADAQRRQAQGSLAMSGRWLWTLGSGIDLDTVVSGQKQYLENGSVPCTHDKDRTHKQCRLDEEEGEIDWETPGRAGFGGAYTSTNNSSFDFDDRFRFTMSSKLALRGKKDPLDGVHDIKLGIEGQQLIWDRTVGVNGNQYYVDWNRTPFDPESFENYYWIEYSKPTKYRTTGSQFSVFAQDSYKPVDNVTLNFGFRYDNSVMRNAEGDAVLRAGMPGPRLYGAWDPWKNGKTKIVTGYGRFNDTGRLGVANFTSRSGFGSKLFLGEGLSDGSGQGFLNTQNSSYSYQPIVNNSFSHDRLRNPYTDEVILMLERQVADALAITSRMSGRFTRNLYEFDDVTTIYDEDGSTNIGGRWGDPDTPVYRVRTPRLAQRNFFKWDLTLRKVRAQNWSGEIRYSFTQAFGSSASSLSGTFANGPQTQFAYGQIPNAQEHVIRANAAWDVPLGAWSPRIGVFFVGGSGIPVERLYAQNSGVGSTFQNRIRERSAYTRLPAFWDLSMRYQQTIDVRRGSFILSFEAQNLTNNRAGGRIASAQIGGGAQLDQTGRYVLLERQDPLRLQVGASYRF